MAQSPEARIYNNAPSAPSPIELRDGLKLLLGTYGKEARTESNVTSQEISIRFGQILRDETSSGGLLFRTTFNTTNEDKERCIGVDVYARKIFPIAEGQVAYKRIQSIEVHPDMDGTLVAVEHDRNRHDKNLSEQERRAVGGVILRAWETLIKSKPTPSKR